MSLPKKLEILKDHPAWIVPDNVIGYAFEVSTRPKLAAEIVRRYNDFEDNQRKINGLLTTLQNALVSLAVIKLPRPDDSSVATDADILKIMEASFAVAIVACEK